MSLGILRTSFLKPETDHLESISSRGTLVDGEFKVVQVLKSNDKWTKFVVKSDRPFIKSKVLLYVSTDVMNYFDFGKGSSLQLCIQTIRNVVDLNPMLFDYNHYLHNKGIYLSAFVKDASEIAVLERNDPLSFFNFFREMICAKIDALYSSPKYSGLQKAIMVGESSDLDEAIMREFRISGAVHVLSISGFHVAVVALSIQYLLGVFGNSLPRFLHMILLLSSIWLFVILAGLGPSAFRSGLMFSLFFIGKLARRGLTSYQVIGFAGVILLVIDPLSIYDLGFQLSFAAVWGIVTFYTSLSTLIVSKNKLIRFLWNSISLSLSAQIGTLPILLYSFKEVSMVFWISDILVVPIMSFLMPLSLALLIGAGIFDAVVIDWLVVLSERIMDFMIWMNAGISNMENSYVDRLPFDGIMYFLFALIIIFLGYVARFGQKRMIMVSFIPVFALLVYNLIAAYLSHHQEYIIQYAHSKNVVIEYVHGQNSTVFFRKDLDRNLSEATKYQQLMLRLNGERNWVDISSDDVFPLKIGNNYWIIDPSSTILIDQKTPIASLFLLGKIVDASPEVFDHYSIQRIVLPKGLSDENRDKWASYTVNRKIGLHLQDEEGLIKMRL